MYLHVNNICTNTSIYIQVYTVNTIYIYTCIHVYMILFMNIVIVNSLMVDKFSTYINIHKYIDTRTNRHTYNIYTIYIYTYNIILCALDIDSSCSSLYSNKGMYM